MRTLAAIFAVAVIATTGVAHAQDWTAPPTRVGEFDLYVCPIHPQIQATWPARCPLCSAVLIRGDGAGGPAVGAVGGLAATDARAQQAGPTGRASNGFRSRARAFEGRPFGGGYVHPFGEGYTHPFGERYVHPFGGTPQQQFQRQFPLTPEQQFRQQFPETPQQQFGQQFPQTPQQQFGRQFPLTPQQQFDRQFGTQSFGGGAPQGGFRR